MPGARRGTEPRLSAWVERFLPLAPRGAGRVLDLACGLGRHSFLASILGFEVLACDREPDFAIRALGNPGIEFRRLNLEAGAWPFGEERFAAIIMTNYLFRPLFAEFPRALAPGGLLICETFTRPESLAAGRPRNPAHWLGPCELPGLVRPLSVIAYEDGLSRRGKFVQRICAGRAASPEAEQRFALGAD